MSGAPRYLSLRFVVMFLAGLSLCDLMIMLGVVVLHASSPAGVATWMLAPMTYLLAGASSAALVLALLYACLAYPANRVTAVALALIVLALLGAHLYTINNPPLGITGTLTDPIGNTVNNSLLIMSSSLSGSTLSVSLTDSGTDAIGNLSLAVGGAPLPGSGLQSQPTPTHAMQPGSQDSGTWFLKSVPAGPVVLTYEDLDCYATDKQVDGCIMDEVYYVPAAQAMLAGEKCAPYQDNCNLEHPFLSKAFIAAGIAMFGNDAFGWRIFQAVLGTFSVPVLFGVCWALTKDARMSLFASFLLAFETLFFVHSSAALIDVGAVFFGLLGFFFYFSRWRWWKLGPTTLTAIAFGLSALSKETAVMLLLVLVAYHLVFGEGNWAQRYFWSLTLAAGIFVVFAAGLQVYDSLFGSGSATTFVGQMDFILKYGASLVMTPTSQGWIDSLLKTPITPLNWITYYSPVGYLVTTVKVSTSTGSSITYVGAGYYGIADQFEVWMVYLWGAYAVYLWRKTKVTGFASEVDARDFRLVRLALIWFLVILLAYVGLYFYGRVTYPYYFIQAVPALAMGGAWFLTRSWFPQQIAYIVLAGVMLWFFIFYPDKAFLPTWLRAAIGH